MDTLLHFGLSNALMATVLALPAALVGHHCRRPALAHGLWLLVLLKLLTPPLLPVPVLWLRPPGLQTATAAAPGPGLGSEPEITGSASVRSPFADGSFAQEPPTTAPPSAAPSLPTGSSIPAEAVQAELPWSWVVGMVWGAGSALWFAALVWRAYRFQRLLRGARRAPPDIQERARWLAQRLGVARYPGVWFVPGRVSPMLWALAGPPRLLLPCGLWNQLSSTQRDTLLAHELAHLRRRDHWVRWLELAAVGLYWWHPVAWWVERELQETGEQCCDAWVVAVLPEAADAYAEALLETVAYLSRARAPMPVGASGAGRVHHLKRRLIMILNGTAPKTLSPAGRWAVLALGAVLLPLWPTWAHSQVSRDRETSPPDRADLVAGPAEDNDREEQIGQARAAVRELTRELDRTQARVDALAGRLQEALARLARLEGRTEPPRASTSQRGPDAHAKSAPPAAFMRQPDRALAPHATKGVPLTNAAPAVAAVNPYAAPAVAAVKPYTKDVPLTNAAPAVAAVNPYAKGGPLPMFSRSDRHGGGDYDQRLREVEAKLDRLLEEFKALRERPHSQPSDRKN